MPLSTKAGGVLIKIGEVVVRKTAHRACEIDPHREGTYFPNGEEVKVILKVMYFLGMY